MKKNISVKLSHVYKKYTIHHDKPTLMEKYVKGKSEVFLALKDIDLEINEGERVGIIGLNGSGKTTFLKLICGISSPSRGKIVTNEKVVSLIDIGAGFHPDLTGMQNIYLNGMLLGMSKEDIKDKLKDIINFAGLGKFIDVPLFTYSDGMKLRLGFSVCIHSEPELLLVDEGITAADEQFNKKIANALDMFFKKKKTFIIATHDIGWIREHCDRIIWLESGKVKSDGGKKILDKYLANNNKKNLFTN